MKIYLLNAPFMDNFVRCGRWQGVAARGGTMYYPIWLSYAAGVLEKEGHKIRLVDAVARKWNNEMTIHDAKAFNPDMIVTDSNFSSLRNDMDIASELKKETGALSVLVGPPASQFSEVILNNDVDIIARFEFDFTLRELSNSIEERNDFKDIKGISYNVNGQIIHNPNRELISSKELDEIPFVSEVYKKHLNIEDYFLNHSLYPMVQIFTGRGCPNLCTFCSWPETLMGRKYRVRSVENVIAEFEYIAKELHVKEIFIEDDAFTLSNRRIKQFCEELKRRDFKIPWSCQSRATLDFGTMNAMKEAGCRLLDVGYESGSEEVLRNIKKNVTLDQLIKFTKNAKKAKLKLLADFVIGFPGETKETAEKTINFIKKIKPDLLQVAVATPIPGTEFYKWCNDNHFLLSTDLSQSIDEMGFQKCIVSYPFLSNDEIEMFVDRALKEYYLSPSFLLVALNNVLGKNGFDELKGMIKSGKVFFKYVIR